MEITDIFLHKYPYKKNRLDIEFTGC